MPRLFKRFLAIIYSTCLLNWYKKLFISLLVAKNIKLILPKLTLPKYLAIAYSGYYHTIVLMVCLLSSLCWGLFPDNASAMLRQHQDAPGIMRYHSQVSIKDDSGYSWQVLLFRKNKLGESDNIHLRLVGFPGIYNFSHPQDLEIITSKGRLLIASDVYKKDSPAANVGEYNMTEILPNLLQSQNNKSTQLLLPLHKQETLTLNIPANLLVEWKWFVNDFS